MNFLYAQLNVYLCSMSIQLQSKLPDVGTTIFTVMSALSNECGAINLSQGFPNYDCDPVLKDLVAKYVSNGYNQYAPMAGLPELNEQLYTKIARLYDVQVHPANEITITAGATQAIYTAITALVQQGDEVVMIEPAYDSYRPSVELCGGVVVPYELSKPDFKVDWQAFEQLITPRTRAILINTPHNPSGMIFSRDDMLELQRITQDTNIIVLSDEVYEHIVFDGEEHQSVLRFPDLFARSIAVYSFGKTFHNTGWKLGYAVAPEYLMEEFRKVHQFNVFCVNRPMQHALADYMKNANNYLDLSPFYQQKRNYFLKAIAASRFRPIACAGTYFQAVDYSDISDERDTDFAKRLTREFGVSAIPISVFYGSQKDEKVVRFCFAKTEDMLAEAGELLCGV